MEIIFQTKRFRRHAFGIGMSAFAIAVLAGIALLQAPAFSSRAVQALVTPGVQVTPSKNGLANIETGNKPEDSSASNIGSAVTAGDRLNTQLEFESAVSR
jgi:hypothetical protein